MNLINKPVHPFISIAKMQAHKRLDPDAELRAFTKEMVAVILIAQNTIEQIDELCENLESKDKRYFRTFQKKAESVVNKFFGTIEPSQNHVFTEALQLIENQAEMNCHENLMLLKHLIVHSKQAKVKAMCRNVLKHTELLLRRMPHAMPKARQNMIANIESIRQFLQNLKIEIV